MKTKALLMSAAAFLSFGNIAFAGDSKLCNSKFVQGGYKSAFRYCEKACGQNDGRGCAYLGWIYAQGLGVKQDYKQAIPYLEKACSLNYYQSCSYLGRIYRDGLGVRQNKKISKEYYGKACDLNKQVGCYEYHQLNEQDY